MCVSPAAIPKVCGSKAGGVVEIYVALEDDIASFTGPAANTLNITAVVMKAGKFPVKWEFDEDQASPLKSAKAENSDAWTITQDFVIPGNRPDVTAQISGMVGGRYVVWSKDGADQIRLGAYISGTTFKGLKLAALEESTGDGFEAKPGMKVQFKRISNKPAYFFTGTIPEEED